MSRRRSIALSLSALCAVAALLTTSCNISHCEDLRDELFTLRKKWQTCEVDSDCSIVGGNTKDCTGILSCNLSINRVYRAEAERRIASLPEETVDCIECKSPNCYAGGISLCEQQTKSCIIIQEIIGPVAPPDESSDLPDAGEVPAASMGDGGPAAAGSTSSSPR